MKQTATFVAKFIPNWNCHFWVSQQTELTQLSETPPTAIANSIILSKGTWSIKFLTATSLLPRSRTSVFSWLIFNPEYVPNKLITLIRVKWDGLSQTRVVMSSANVTNLISFPFPLILLIWRLFGMEITNNSRTMIKRDGESGSPWRTPRLTLKDGVKKPLLTTLLVIFL